MSTISHIKGSLTAEEKARIAVVFTKLDRNQNGALDKMELIVGLHELGHPSATLETVEAMMAEVGLAEAKDVTRVRFKTVSPQVSQRSAWVRILQQEKPFEVSGVDLAMDAAKRTIAGTTGNVATLELQPPLELPAAGKPAEITITLDGHTVVKEGVLQGDLAL